jgi:hypothetical protein
MVVLSSEKFSMDADKTIPGRARLFGVQIACTNKYGPGGSIAVEFASALEYRVIEFRNGSDTADILFKFAIPVGIYGIGATPYPFMFGNMSILFTDGIFVPKLEGDGADDPDPAKTSLVVFYEVG